MRRGDESAQSRELLTLMLTEEPGGLSVAELETRLGGVAFQGALEELIADGLLVREDDTVAPTAAATRFYELRSLAAEG